MSSRIFSHRWNAFDETLFIVLPVFCFADTAGDIQLSRRAR